jgi:prephenate dehydratase
MSKRKKIVFQGEPGANSHIACVEAYPDCEPLPCPTFEDALGAVASGEADLGMIPIENSLAGRVADIHHLMPTSGLHIIGEWFLPIRNQLMAPRGATLDGLKTVESHVMALGQCRNDPRGGRVAARREDLRPRHPGRGHRGRGSFDHALHRALARR